MNHDTEEKEKKVQIEPAVATTVGSKTEKKELISMWAIISKERLITSRMARPKMENAPLRKPES